MNLLFVGTNRGPGGTETHFASMAVAMSAAGHRVGAVVRPAAFIHQTLAANPEVKLFAAGFEGGNNLRAGLAVWRACRAFRPDVIIGTFEREYRALMLIAWQQRLPLVLFRHLEQPIRSDTMRVLPHFIKCLIAPSDYLRLRLIEHGIPQRMAKVLHNPVDTHHFCPSAEARRVARNNLGLGDDDVLVAYLGRFETQKGVFTLSRALDEAMTLCPEIRSLWVGHGTSEPELVADVARSANAAKHLWRPWATDVLQYYSAADMVVLPSERNEAFGRTMIEAQSCGVPVLGSDSGGIPETMLPGVSGLLVPPGDISALASAIVGLARSKTTRESLGAAGRSLAQSRFDSAVIAGEFSSMLEGMTRSVKAPRSSSSQIIFQPGIKAE